MQRFTTTGSELVNVVGRRAGQLAPPDRGRRRPATRPPCPTRPAAPPTPRRCIELARVFDGRPPRRRSCSRPSTARTLGEVGTRRLIERLPAPGPDRRGDRGRPSSARARAAEPSSGVVERRRAAAASGSSAPWPSRCARSSGSARRGHRLVQPARPARVPDRDRRPGRAARRRARRPAHLGQRRAAAARATARRRRRRGPPRRPRPGRAADVHRARRRGRARARPAATCRSSQLLPGWAISLLAGTLLLPALVASVDAFARARRRQRRRAAVAALARRLGRAVPGGARAGELLALAGATPAPPPAPVPPDVLPLDGPRPGRARRRARGGARVVFGALAGGPAGARAGQSARARRGRRARPGARRGLALPGRSTRTPGLLAVPAAHLWMLAALTRAAPSRRLRARADRRRPAAGAARGALLPVPLRLGPLEGVWYVFLLVTGHRWGSARRCSAACCWRAAGRRRRRDGRARGRMARWRRISGRAPADDSGHTEVRGMTGRRSGPDAPPRVEQGEYVVERARSPRRWCAHGVLEAASPATGPPAPTSTRPCAAGDLADPGERRGRLGRLAPLRRDA